MPQSPSLSTGDLAPEFALPDAAGNRVRLSDFRGKWVVLYFYPKDETPVCTKEACAFRDAYQDFMDRGATVIGVSRDSPASHAAFAQKRRLPFLLLSDESGDVERQYGVTKWLGLLPERKTFLIDPNGRIHTLFSSPLQAQAHVKSMLDVLNASQSTTR